MASTLLAEEVELLGDSKYRAYISQVEKALKSFEYTSEWADLISALGKLNKVDHIFVPDLNKLIVKGLFWNAVSSIVVQIASLLLF